MEGLDRLITAARELRAAGATSVRLGTNEHGAPYVEVSFVPPPAPVEKPAEMTDEQIAAERERVLMHST